jgi:hypothetical protein
MRGLLIAARRTDMTKLTSLGEVLRTEKIPGHWVLAWMGKRVLRPGGLELTCSMLETLDIKSADEIVEFTPGMGVIAHITLSLGPASYTAVEQDKFNRIRVNSFSAKTLRSSVT